MAPQVKMDILGHLGCQESLVHLEPQELLETKVMWVFLAQWDHQALQVQMAKMEKQALRDLLDHQVRVAPMAFLAELANLELQVARVLLDLLEHQVRRVLLVRQGVQALKELLGPQALTAGMAKSVRLDLSVHLGLQARRDCLGHRAFLGWMVLPVRMALMDHKDQGDLLVFLGRQDQMVLLELQVCLGCQDPKASQDLQAQLAPNWISENCRVQLTLPQTTLVKSSMSQRS